MFHLRFPFPLLALCALCSCSAVGLASSDGGTSEGGAGGTVTARNASFSGTASAGTLSLVLANDATSAIDSLSEVRVTVGSGEQVFPFACSKCVVGTDAWCVGPAATSSTVRIGVAQLDLTGGATLTTTCKGASAVLRATADSPGAATSDVPLSVTLKGFYPDGSKWVATTAVQ